ncbi:uncharacterized protein PRCAT00000121001 [Priceomyces carsonii]|uniref:uncharacterized protein n=1 Tax=Priceomyces carsonii TaxID=28549 RepID=UPI002EDB8AA5|nr:unnamed protein product [Priceomyces carsonii]
MLKKNESPPSSSESDNERRSSISDVQSIPDGDSDHSITSGIDNSDDAKIENKTTLLRESGDAAKIYKSISQNSEAPLNEPKKNLSNGKSSIGFALLSPNVIGNPWSFFNRNSDNQESRYKNEEEEEKDKEMYPPNNDTSIQNEPDAPSHVHGTNMNTNDRYRPGSPRSNLNNENDGQFTEDESRQKFMRKFQIFGRKKNKDKRKSTAAPIDVDELEVDDENATVERARHLIATLTIGSPAINILASCLLEDEHGIARSPLLLTLLGLKVIDISPSINTKLRRFKIELDYGVGPQRMKWSVDRTAKDLLYLHSKFKFDNWRNDIVGSKNTDLPKYPIPPLLYRRDNARMRSRAGKATGDLPENGDLASEPQGREHDLDASSQILRQPDNASILSNHTFREQFAHLRSHLSSISSLSSDEPSPDQLRKRVLKNQEYVKDVTKYLNDLIQLVSLKPQSNRLFQFFEISPISSLLSYETGYTGKQGVIHIGGTAKSQGWRVGHFKANDLKNMIDRRSEKWLLIRNSYVMYVSDINSTSPLEVFLVDSSFKINFRRDDITFKDDDESDYDDSSLIQKKIAHIEDSDVPSKNVFKHLKITLENSERKLVLIPKSLKEQKLWIQSLNQMKNSSIWSEKNRFDSFAPIRHDCFAQWFVDGRDYFWAVSSAIEMAKDVVFIHDWWLSPELYLRRPANGNQQWRIDRLLQRKAQQGVKIFVIIYRNVGTTVATDSLYTKHSLLSLNEENIHVIRSPNQLLQNTYFWAHHEKLCVVDQTIAFVGGIDLCYGRFDTPDHVLVDDSKINFTSLDPNERFTNEEFIKFQTFPGKDYSNPRVKDFSSLDKPYESMYDRNAVPRMPWHDVHMVTSGKVARDLARHFVQRWNYLIRQKRPSRFTPLLIPPPDMTDAEVKELGLEGTCQIQLLRSSGNWSLGLKHHEQSIQNAYLKLIETSEHFVYIENQFFVTSCFIDGNEIHNRIGDALVDRIIRAYNEGTDWRAVIVIPLMPGFESQVDEPDGSSVRVIMQCQFMSISRGSTSIFAKLRKYGIEPDDYIQFFSLRKWGRVGPQRTLVTEQLYVHAKTMVVDDRAAIIGSANINERSMRGIRDSEVAVVVQDKETIATTMGGESYLAGKFAHTLRMRLMREHLGVSVDILDIVERRFWRFESFARTEKGLIAATSHFKNFENIVLSAMVEIASRDVLNEPKGTFRWKNYRNSKNLDPSVFDVPLSDIQEHEEALRAPTPLSLPVSFNNRTGEHEANKGIRDKKKHSFDARVQHNENHKRDVYGDGLDKYKSKLARRARFNSGKMLKELAHKAMEERPNKVFLPDIETVYDFLQADDFDMVDEMDDECERIISERNKERWLLLKKISYLQRVAAREKGENEEESKKRVGAGLSPNVDLAAKKSNVEPDPHNVVPNTDLQMHNSVPVGAWNVDSSSKSLNSLPEKKAVEPLSTETFSEDVPIVSFNEESAREVIKDIESRGIKSSSLFVDPYCFEDPLDEEFYEDLWYENARKNTELFRIVFHTQPDNNVQSWKNYKQYSKLNRAFVISQQREAKYRHRSEADSSSEESEDENDNKLHYRPGFDSNNSKATINMNTLDQDVGLLGQVPPEPLSDTINGDQKSAFNGGPKRKLVRAFNSKEDTQGEGEDGKTEDVGKEKANGKGEDELGDKMGDDSDTTQEANEPLSNNARESTLNGPSPNLNGQMNETTSSGKRRRTRRRPNFTARRAYMGERIFERDSAERLLKEIRGNLVLFPVDWLLRELDGGNWFYNTDRIPPIDIYD